MLHFVFQIKASGLVRGAQNAALFRTKIDQTNMKLQLRQEVWTAYGFRSRRFSFFMLPELLYTIGYQDMFMVFRYTI